MKRPVAKGRTFLHHRPLGFARRLDALVQLARRQVIVDDIASEASSVQETPWRMSAAGTRRGSARSTWRSIRLDTCTKLPAAHAPSALVMSFAAMLFCTSAPWNSTQIPTAEMLQSRGGSNMTCSKSEVWLTQHTFHVGFSNLRRGADCAVLPRLVETGEVCRPALYATEPTFRETGLRSSGACSNYVRRHPHSEDCALASKCAAAFAAPNVSAVRRQGDHRCCYPGGT